jgi:hypothetical protein
MPQKLDLTQLSPYSESAQCTAQMHCDYDLARVLDGLLGLVAIADMPPEARAHFVAGIGHLRAHIQSELCTLLAERTDRVN